MHVICSKSNMGMIKITKDVSDPTPKYVDGDYQSGPGELLWAAGHEVDGTS